MWKTRTDKAYAETDTAQKFIDAEVQLNPIAQLLDKCSDPTENIVVVEDEIADRADVIFGLEDEIVDRANVITEHVKHIAATARSVEREAQARLVELSKKLSAAAAPVAVADDDDSQGLKAALWAAAPAAAAVVDDDDSEGLKAALWAAAPAAAAVVDDDDSEEFKARCSEIIEAGEDLPSEMQQEMLDISGRILKKEEATIDRMEQAYHQLLKDNVEHEAKVIVLVDEEQDKVQQSFGEIQQSFKDLLVECYAQRGMPFTLSTQEAHPLVYLADDFRRCLELVVVTGNNANQMRAHYSYPRTQVQMNPHAWVEGQPAPEDEVLAAAPAEMREAFEGKEGTWQAAVQGSLPVGVAEEAARERDLVEREEREERRAGMAASLKMEAYLKEEEERGPRMAIQKAEEAAEREGESPEQWVIKTKAQIEALGMAVRWSEEDGAVVASGVDYRRGPFELSRRAVSNLRQVLKMIADLKAADRERERAAAEATVREERMAAEAADRERERAAAEATVREERMAAVKREAKATRKAEWEAKALAERETRETRVAAWVAEEIARAAAPEQDQADPKSPRPFKQRRQQDD